MVFFDIFQQYRIEKSSLDSKQGIGEAKRKSSDNEISIRTLEAKIDHLSLVCMAMGELLEEVGFSKKMLLNKIEEIDLRDGKLDGVFSNWYKNGKKKSEGYFKAGKQEALWSYWYESGDILREQQMRAGKLHGSYTVWNTQGLMYKKELYSDGVLQRALL